MISSGNLRHCHEFGERVLSGVTSWRWTRFHADRVIIAAHSKSGSSPRMDLCRFTLIGCGLDTSLRIFNMSLKGSAILPGQLNRLKFGISDVLHRLPCWRPSVRSSISAPGLSYQKEEEDGCNINAQNSKEGAGSELCTMSTEQEPESQEDRERRERRLWQKGLRKSVYERLRKDRITVELFPDLNFALDGNYYPRLVPLVAKKINTLLDKEADDDIAELLDFLGISLNPHLVGEVLKLPNDWGVSLRFFVWARYQPEYEHNAHTYNQLLCNLAKSKKENLDYVVASLDLLHEMVKDGLTPSTVAVNIVIDRLCKANKTKVAVKVMRELEGNGVCLDLFTYNSIINGLGKCGRFKEIFKLLEEMELKGIQPDLLTYNSVIHSLGNAGRWQEAYRVFEELPDRGLTPDVITYNSLICGMFKSGQADEAFTVFQSMSLLTSCEPDVVTYNSLICGLAKARRLEDALKIFRAMKGKDCDPDVITYNTLIGELIFRSKFAEVSGLLLEMKETGCLPTKTTRYLLLEIGLVDRIRALWGPEVADHLDSDSGGQ